MPILKGTIIINIKYIDEWKCNCLHIDWLLSRSHVIHNTGVTILTQLQIFVNYRATCIVDWEIYKIKLPTTPHYQRVYWIIAPDNVHFQFSNAGSLITICSWVLVYKWTRLWHNLSLLLIYLQYLNYFN